VHVIQSLPVDLSSVRRIARECQAWLLIRQMRNVSFVYAKGASTVIRTISVILGLVFLDRLSDSERDASILNRSDDRTSSGAPNRAIFSPLFLCLPLFPNAFFRNMFADRNVESSRQSGHSKSLWTGFRCFDVLTRYKPSEKQPRRDTERIRTKTS